MTGGSFLGVGAIFCDIPEVRNYVSYQITITILLHLELLGVIDVRINIDHVSWTQEWSHFLCFKRINPSPDLEVADSEKMCE